MSRVTSKLQVTVPKAIAEQYGIRPGDEIEWLAAGDTIRVLPPGRRKAALDIEARLRLFDSIQRRSASAGDRQSASAAAQLGIGGGVERISTSVPALVDTNVLVYRFDPRFPQKQQVATQLLRRGIIENSIRVPHQEYGLTELISEDFEHDRLYGTVRAVNPFL